MATVVLKLFAGQVSVTDGQTIKAATICFPLQVSIKLLLTMTTKHCYLS